MDKLEFEAIELIDRANKKIACVGFLDNYIFDCADKKIEDACDIYVQGANKYKQCKLYEKAGDILFLCANKSATIKYQETIAIRYHKEAIDCYLCLDYNDALMAKINVCFDKIMIYYLAAGKFYDAGKLCELLGDHLKKYNYLDLALINYNHANKYYDVTIENKITNPLAQCMLKQANIYATMKKYQLAVEKFESASDLYQKQNLPLFTNTKIKDIWRDISICLSAMNDLVALKKTFDKYSWLQKDIMRSPVVKDIEQIINSFDDLHPTNLNYIMDQFDLHDWRKSALDSVIAIINANEDENEDYC